MEARLAARVDVLVMLLHIYGQVYEFSAYENNWAV